MIIHEDQSIIVRNGWLSGWRIECKRTGRTFVPSRDQTEKIGIFWYDIRNRGAHLSLNKRRSENMLMQAFAWAVMEPDLPTSRHFMEMERDAYVALIISLSNEIELERQN